MGEPVFNLIGIVLVAIGFICIAVGAPLLAVNILRMSQHKREQPSSWHDLWGANRNNLLFFPRLLDEEGQRYRDRALSAGRIVLLGLLCSLIALSMGTLDL